MYRKFFSPSIASSSFRSPSWTWVPASRCCFRCWSHQMKSPDPRCRFLGSRHQRALYNSTRRAAGTCLVSRRCDAFVSCNGSTLLLHAFASRTGRSSLAPCSGLWGVAPDVLRWCLAPRVRDHPLRCPHEASCPRSVVCWVESSVSCVWDGEVGGASRGTRSPHRPVPPPNRCRQDVSSWGILDKVRSTPPLLFCRSCMRASACTRR